MFLKSMCFSALAAGAAMAASSELPEPHIFAPGVISGPSNDGAPTFTPDGKTIYFERTNNAWTTILESHMSGGRWSKPVLAPFMQQWPGQQAALSPDGRTLMFESTRPDPASVGHSAAHLYQTMRTKDGWSIPTELPATVNIARRVFKPSITVSGDIYFMADTGQNPAAAPDWRLFVSRFAAGQYAQAERVDLGEGQYPDVDPYIAPDQSYLIFSSRNRPPFSDGHEHLFISYRTAGNWSAPAPLRYKDDVHTPDDGEAQVGPDGRTLYFISGRTMPVAADRSRAQVTADLARMEAWDNSNANVWTIPLPDRAARKPS